MYNVLLQNILPKNIVMQFFFYQRTITKSDINNIYTLMKKIFFDSIFINK